MLNKESYIIYNTVIKYVTLSTEKELIFGIEKQFHQFQFCY